MSNVKKHYENIPLRIRELRDILDITPEEMAEKLEIDVEYYNDIESGKKDIPISMLYEVASILGVDFTTLLTGDSPKMKAYTVVRAGAGAVVERYPGYDYTSLCYNFIGREMEPMLVHLQPEDKMPALVSHSGQEFNYVLKGRVRVVIGKKEHILCTGDCIYFDPLIPHGQQAVDEPAEFLTVIKE